MYICMIRHETFTDLLRNYSKLIWSMCHDAAHGDYEQCRDLFQDVSLRLWQHFEELRPDAQPYECKAWVEWQTRHVLEHAGRRQRPEPLSELPERADDDALVNVEICTLVNDLLAQLRPDDRQVLKMRMEGYSACEIAKEMGLNRDSVYQRIHRALKKARRAMLVVFLLLVVTTIAIAVVPSWRQWVFNSGDSAVEDTVPVCIPATPSSALPPESDSTGDSVVSRCTWTPPEPISHLVAIADTTLPMIPQTLSDPCGCPDTSRNGVETAGCDHDDDTDEISPGRETDVTIIVTGNIITVEGVDNEIVDVFDAQGRLVTTAQCNGQCTLTIRPDHTYSRNVATMGIYWVQVGDSPRQRIFMNAIPAGDRFQSFSPPRSLQIY